MLFGKKKKWRCLNCGHEFETDWRPWWSVKCPKCGASGDEIVRIDSGRGGGAGPRFRRGICRRGR